MENKQIKLIGVDLDGTLLNERFELSGPVLDAYHRAIGSGIQIIVVTGRDKLSALPFLNQLGAEQTFIGSGGAQIWLKGELVLQTSFTQQQTIDIIALGNELGAGMYIDQPGQTWRYGALYYTDLFGHVSESNGTDRIEDVLTELPIKISLIQEPAVLDELRDRLREMFPGVTITSPFSQVLDVNPEGSNKGISLTQLAEMLGIGLEHIAVIGDSENDLSMFAVVDRSYAMGNADEKIRLRATDVAPANNENGVAWVLERIMEENSKTAER
jgi:Cof subfamily protein (haloacid dehalogenase superfamily)